MKQFGAFIRKEFFHILRDRRTMLIVLVMPVILIVLFGFALSTEVRNIDIAVLSPEPDQTVLRLADRFDASRFFTLRRWLAVPDDIHTAMKSGQVQMVLVFQAGFSNSIADPDGTAIQMIVDASDANMARSYSSYASAVIADFIRDEMPAVSLDNIRIEPRYLYNPRMKSAFNFVPGIMGLVMMLICAMMTSISIVREKESGTMEVLLVSPVKPVYMVISKMVPYFVLSCINMITILLLSVFVLHVPVAGSITALMLVSLLYIIANLALGLLISTIADHQVIALMFSGLLLMVPTILLSGMIFPIESMPWPLQTLSALLPPTWYIAAVRKLMIQGLPLAFAWKETLILAAMAVLLIVASVRKINNRLE